MKRLAVIIIVLISFIANAKADYYIAYATTTVNLRACPSTNCEVLAKVPKNEILFVDTEEYEDGFYHVIFVELDKSGWIHSKYVQLYKKVEEQDGNVLSLSGESQNYDPEVNILNDADVAMTLAINSEEFHFNPHESKTITLSPGEVKLRASSPGIIPYVGKDKVVSNGIYDWKFYVITQYRK